MTAGKTDIQEGVEKMRQLASQAAWNEMLGRAQTVIVPLNPDGARIPFYCVHSLSGKATDYVHLARLLGRDQPFFALQMPTRLRNPELGGEIAPVSLQAIAAYYATALKTFQPTGPLALGGWSVGAILALEMARQLRAEGRNVSLLVSFDMAPWNSGVMAPPAVPVSVLSRAANAPFWVAHHHLWRKFSFRALKERAIRKAAAMTVTPQDGARFAVGDFLDASKYASGHLALAQKMLDLMLDYAPQAYDGEVQVYAASTEVAFDHVPRLKAEWRAIAPRARLLRVGGSHRDIIDESRASALARHLGKRLAESGLPR